MNKHLERDYKGIKVKKQVFKKQDMILISLITKKQNLLCVPFMKRKSKVLCKSRSQATKKFGKL